MWMPWNGLIVIGKRIELLGRNTQKPRMWDPKIESEYWGLEDVKKTILKETAGLSQGRMGVKLQQSAANALQASAGLGKDNPKEVGKQEFNKIGTESESAGTTTGSRRGSGFKERSRFTWGGTSGEDMRSRGYKLGQNKDELRSSGEKLVEKKLSGEKLRSSGEELVFKEEKLGTSEEDLRSTGDEIQSSAKKLGPSRQKLGTSGEKLKGSKMGSINEEQIERVVEVTGNESNKMTDAEMEIPFERMEGNDEKLEGAEKVVEDVLGGVSSTDESVSMEEKEVIDEGIGE
ncbi:hypothetical protein mRhiFer1_008203 [Rhinolophus ferrumequinum]|uniref:Uncharacterized protein n=2 Tax=Rhinolophus ferrumequinum TaxID=59479 RepID=A0A7J7W7T1_RHIFE|nr:hypothetical protein mRhiFer1_008203 [Rhinolophus ferrumequinum]